MPSASPTLSDIAQKAGVTKATVSMALRNHPRISRKQCLRIQKMAVDMDYRSNALLGQLMHQLRQSRKQRYVATLALVNASPDPNHLKLTVVMERFAGATERAKQLGYRVDHFWLHEPGMTPNRLAGILRSRNIQGVAFHGYEQEKLPEYEAVWSKFPSITIGSRVRNPALHFVANDQYSTALHACEQLRRRGYKRIGIITNRSSNAKLEHRFVAGLRARPEFGDSVEPLYLEKPYDPEGCRLLRTWLATSRPDAILGVGGCVFIRWIRDSGVRVPGDIGVVLLDIQPEMKGIAAGMDQQNTRLGMTAIDVLVTQVQRHEPGVPAFQQGTLIESSWVPGPTVRNVPITNK